MFKIKLSVSNTEHKKAITKKGSELLYEHDIPSLDLCISGLEDHTISYRRHWYSVAAIATHYTGYTTVYLWSKEFAKWDIIRHIK